MFTGVGDYTFTRANAVIVKKTVGAATAVSFANPVPNCEYVVTDGKGDAAMNPITIIGGGFNINGGPSYVLSTNRGSATLFFDGDEFYVIGANP